MHRPSEPEDLDPPELLWARATALALLQGDEDYTLSENELYCWNGGGAYWWRLSLFADGRAVFCGQDSDGSLGHLRDDPVDFLAGGPEWLPWEQLRDDAEGLTLGYVYWWQDGGWSRAPYPADLEDDGLEMSASWVGDEAPLHDALWDLQVPAEELSAYLGRAAARTVDEQAMRRLLTAVEYEDDTPEHAAIGTALSFARKAGLTAE
jgi:hypothetical protein